MTIASTYSRAAPLAGLPAQPKPGDATGYFGIQGLDALLPQGLTYDSQIMIHGETGIGKSALAAQFLYEGLVVGDTCVYSACDETPNNMRLHMAGFRLGTVAYERIGQFIVLDAYGRELSGEQRIVLDPTNLDEYFLYERRTVEEALSRGRSVRLVVDSLSTIMTTNLPGDIIEFNSNRLRYLRSKRVLTLDNYVANVLDERTLAGLSHAYGLIVRLNYRSTNGMLTRSMQLGKLKSGQFSAAEHQYSIDPRTGIIMQS
jgi:KaiC/GvpD/RAD55 family RecA-like ATPase